MPDQQQPHKPNPNLTEISHLFLSSIRDKTTSGAPRPQRKPPQPQPQPNVSIDLTAEEFARVFADDEQTPDRGPAPVPQITAVIGAHLNGKQFDRAKEYARHLAGDDKRIGLIEIDASEFRVMLFDPNQENEQPPRSASAEPPQAECFDPRRMNEVLEELSWDVQQWLLVLPNPRVPEARNLLRDVRHWVLLSTCDHDGVISCYRTLKGLLELWPVGDAAAPPPSRPALALSLLDATDDAEAERVAAKLAGVCQQFLNWPLEAQSSVRPNQQVVEHLAICCRPRGDKSQAAAAPQWSIVSDFIARSRIVVSPVAATPEDLTKEDRVADVADDKTKKFVADVVVPSKTPPKGPVMSQSDENRTDRADRTEAPSIHLAAPLAGRVSALSGSDRQTEDVIDLPAMMDDDSETSIVEAILRHCASELVECPIAPPMCPRARLAVSRDRRVVMLAVARSGLTDLNTIGQAYRWLQENQNLIGMAVPQLAIDTHQPPHLSLLIDQHDTAAETLQPMLRTGNVTVQTYRKLRWGGKTGLLLQAA